MSIWRTVPLRAIYQRVELRGRADLPLLSVYRDHGVVPRDDRDDNNNRPSEDLSTYKYVRPGDLVVNKMKTWQGSLAVSGHEGIVSPAYFVGRRVAEVDDRFMHHLLRSMPLIAEYGARSKGIRPSQWDLPWDEFAAIKVSLPEAQEQRAIADFLDNETARIDALIEKKQRSIHLLQERVEVLIADFLDPLIAIYGETPLKFVASVDVSNVDKKSYDGQETVRLCNYTDVYYNRVINNAIEFMPATADPHQVKRLTLRAGDVLITKDSETADDIAVPALVEVDLPGVVLGYHLALLRPRQMKGDFLYWALRSRRCRDAFSLAASGVTRVGLRQDAMGRVPIPAPDVSVQQTVAQKLNREAEQMESVIRLLTRQLELLREHRQALITAAVMGQIEVPGVAA